MALHDPQITPNWLRTLLVSSLWSPSSLHIIITKPWPFNGANLPLVALTGSEESCYRNQACQSWRKYSMKHDSVLDQQFFSGKNVSLILCVWKPGYMKSSHICDWIYKIRSYRPRQEVWFFLTNTKLNECTIKFHCQSTRVKWSAFAGCFFKEQWRAVRVVWGLDGTLANQEMAVCGCTAPWCWTMTCAVNFLSF